MRIRGMAALALVASVLAGCGDGDADSVDVDDDAAWRTSQDPVRATGLTWAAESTVHLSDGSTIDTGEPVQAFVVGGDGVFFVPADEDNDGTFREADLFFAGPDGEGVDTGLDVDTGGLRTSPDGTTLAVLEADYDEGTAVMRLFDLSAGTDVTSEDGMKPESSDPVDELLEAEVEILGIDDDEVFARTLQGDYAYDLASGRGRALGGGEEIPGSGADPLTSPDGAWRIEQPQSAGFRDVLVPTSGDDLLPRPGTPQWTLSSWLDATTVLGVAIDAPDTGQALGPDDTLTLMTCQVPSGACEPVEGTAGEQVALPLGTQPTALIDLRPREESS